MTEDHDLTTDVTSTKEIRAREPEPVGQGYWSPGARLVARTATAPTVRRSTARSSGLLLAAAILLLAALIAFGLWAAALWAQSDEDDVDPSAAAIVTPASVVAVQRDLSTVMR